MTILIPYLTVFSDRDRHPLFEKRRHLSLSDVINHHQFVFDQPRRLIARQMRGGSDKRVEPKRAECEQQFFDIVGDRKIIRVRVCDLHPYPADLIDVGQEKRHDVVTDEDHRPALACQDISQRIAADAQRHQRS